MLNIINRCQNFFAKLFFGFRCKIIFQPVQRIRQFLCVIQETIIRQADGFVLQDGKISSSERPVSFMASRLLQRAATSIGER